MSFFSSTLLSAPPGSSPFPPASPSFIFSSAVLSSSSRLCTPTSSLSSDRSPLSHALKSSSSVLWLSVTMTILGFTHCPYLLQYRLVHSPLCPRHPQHPSPDPHFADVNLLFHCLCLCPCFTAVQNPWKNHSLYNSHLCQLTHVFILPYFPYK